jgi:hypothetical protein
MPAPAQEAADRIGHRAADEVLLSPASMQRDGGILRMDGGLKLGFRS